MKFLKNMTVCLLLLSIALVGFSGCGKEDPTTAEDPTVVVIEVADYGNIEITLSQTVAPLTVANFKKLVSEGFYNGLIFHRIASLSSTGDGYMIIQGGDPGDNRAGDPPDKIKGEFSANRVKNTLSHVRGTVSMARSTAYDSASTQFFICADDCTFLDGNYAAFATVTAGMDVVDALAEVAVSTTERPLVNVVMTHVYIK